MADQQQAWVRLSQNCFVKLLQRLPCKLRSTYRFLCFFFLLVRPKRHEFIPIQPIKGSVTLDRSSQATYHMLAEGFCTASHMNVTGFWCRQRYASRRSLHRIMHAMSWTQLGRAACAAFARTTTKGIQSFSPSTTTSSCLKTRPKSCWVHYEGEVCLTIDSEALVWRPLDKSTSAVDPPNRSFPRTAKDIEMLITKQQLSLPQNQATLGLMGSYCLQGLWNVRLQAWSTDDDQCTWCKEGPWLEVCGSP